MARTGRIEGRVVAHDGRPLADVLVLLSARSFDRGPDISASTSTGGEYRLGDLEPGSYTVLVSSRTHGDHSARIPVGPTTPARLDFVLPD